MIWDGVADLAVIAMITDYQIFYYWREEIDVRPLITMMPQVVRCSNVIALAEMEVIPAKL